MLSPLLVVPILRYKCLDAQCISNTTRVCLKALEKHFFLLKEELRDQIREGVIQTEQACLQWLEDEERVDRPNQKLEDLWSILLPLERGELRVREWNRYIRKYRRSLKLVEDSNEASEIRHLLKDVLPGH